MKNTRRDLLKFAGGAAVGVLFTPAPWRLLTDTALWSENWPGIPIPKRGEVRTRYTHCSLCPAGCAVRARSIGEQPVSLAGVNGGLCPFGVAGHHLPYITHPAAPPDKDRLSAAIANCPAGEHVAVLDLRPGRTASWTYRRAMAAVNRGLYVAPAQPTVSINLESTKTVFSLGAPLLDGWIAPSRAFAARERFRLIQAEAVESRTAALADTWLPVGPGAEEALAAARAHAAELADNGLVIDPAMSPAVVAMNVSLGAWGKTIGPRTEAPVPAEWKQKAAPVTALEAVPDGSIRVLLIDDAMPGEYIAAEEIQRKLAPAALRVSIPAPVYPQAADDLPVPVDSPAPTFRLAVPLVPPPAGAVNAAEFVASLAGLAAGDALRERADAIHAAGRGKLITYADGNSTPVKDVKPEDFWKALNAGGCWIGEVPAAGPAPSVELAAPAAAMAGVLAPEPAIASSPLLSKLYRESNLRLAPNQVALHPSSGFEEGARAVLETAASQRQVEVRLDAGVRPGVVVAGSRELAGVQGRVVRI
jgi:hypothetical protein